MTIMQRWAAVKANFKKGIENWNAAFTEASRIVKDTCGQVIDPFAVSGRIWPKNSGPLIPAGDPKSHCRQTKGCYNSQDRLDDNHWRHTLRESEHYVHCLLKVTTGEIIAAWEASQNEE